VIRKDETHLEAETENIGPKILKICTFKVGEKYQGEKFGELLLKQVLWFAQHNKYDLAYVTVYPKQAFLIDLSTMASGVRRRERMANWSLKKHSLAASCLR
jgi:hypothetical protein